MLLRELTASGVARNFHLEVIAQGILWDAVCKHCLQVLTAETIKMRKFRTIDLLFLDQYVLRIRAGLSDILGT